MKSIIHVYQDLDDDDTNGEYAQVIVRDQSGSGDAYLGAEMEVDSED
ncbi:MAG: hypothetical protein ABIA04_04700 [Pseudomonadota bacterium]